MSKGYLSAGPNDCSDISPDPQDEVDRMIAEDVEAEREKCCKDICPSCKKGIAVYEAINTWQYEANDTWLHNVRVGTSEVVVACAAKAIRERAAKENACPSCGGSPLGPDGLCLACLREKATKDKQ